MSTRIGLLLAMLIVATTACGKPKAYEATVALMIDGKSHNYRTTVAHIEVRSNPGTYSVYLRRKSNDDQQQRRPYVSLRTYSGSPVRRLSLHYRPPGSATALRYECFVPGKLKDGRSTLG